MTGTNFAGDLPSFAITESAKPNPDQRLIAERYGELITDGDLSTEDINKISVGGSNGKMDLEAMGALMRVAPREIRKKIGALKSFQQQSTAAQLDALSSPEWRTARDPDKAHKADDHALEQSLGAFEDLLATGRTKDGALIDKSAVLKKINFYKKLIEDVREAKAVTKAEKERGKAVGKKAREGVDLARETNKDLVGNITKELTKPNEKSIEVANKTLRKAGGLFK